MKYTYANYEYKRTKRGRYNKRYYARTANRNPRPWTAEEDRLVATHVTTDRDLADELWRSVRAIQHRRHRLKSNKEVLA